MYNELDTSKPTCKKYLENGEEFVKKHEKLNNPNNTKDSAYYKVLYTLSNDYNNFKKYCDNSVDCNDTPLLPEIKTTQNSVQNSELSFEDTSSIFVIWISKKIKKNKEENGSLICDSKSNDYLRNMNNDLYMLRNCLF
ncbi:Plasmodium variant antigen protein Cir/Yir/Bir, putative [Plasmodium berghei]|uniref:Plasmodium variant antigen protein Cir/Yir/Bir, putative n=1 Tax=Plasmodium berghei TaxID=5821 RepID=A0A1C6YHL8_PLABE|nr:Plasmodium variant antigen protein Cir/Yir/Bir, putative [Plasmodium berghei]